jgi:hypothetical protein
LVVRFTGHPHVVPLPHHVWANQISDTLEELKTQINTATDRERVDAVNALRVRHRRQVNAPLRGLITNILEDNQGNAINEEADEDNASEGSVSEDKKPEDKTVLSSFDREKQNTSLMI